MGEWKKEGLGKNSRMTTPPKKNGFWPPLVRYVFHPPSGVSALFCFSCTKIHDRADQKLFWRGSKIFGRARSLVRFPHHPIRFAPPPSHGPRERERERDVAGQVCDQGHGEGRGSPSFLPWLDGQLHSTRSADLVHPCFPWADLPDCPRHAELDEKKFSASVQEKALGTSAGPNFRQGQGTEISIVQDTARRAFPRKFDHFFRFFHLFFFRQNPHLKPQNRYLSGQKKTGT